MKLKIKALLVGVSYEGQGKLQRPGLEDVKAMEKFIKDNFEWSAIRVLHKNASDDRQPTRKNIINGFRWLVDGAKSEKHHLFFYFSGHGGLKDNVSRIVPVDWEDAGEISAARMRKELVDPLDDNQQLTGFFQHCHSGNSLELPYICKKPSDLENAHFTRTSFDKVCFGASNVQLDSYHGKHMSCVTKAFLSGYEDGTSIRDVYKIMEDGDSRGRPEFSCSHEIVEPITFLDLQST